MLICKTPFRISLFGGGTDFPQWYSNNKGMVISYTIDKYCYVTLRRLPDFFTSKYRLRYFKNEYKNKIEDILHPSIKAIISNYDRSKNKLEVIHSGDIPGLSGLASSSAFTVSFLNLILNHNKIKKNNFELGKMAIDIEQNVLKESVGSQDQIACAIGGLNCIQFEGDKISYKKIMMNNIIKRIVSNSTIIFTGYQRRSSIIEINKISRINKNKFQLNEIYNIAQEARKLIYKNSNDGYFEICSLMRENWKLKKELSNLVSNSFIENLYEFAMNNGALAGKILGAGGGGFMLLMSKNKKEKSKLLKKLKKFYCLNHKIENKGSHIVYKDTSDYYLR